MPTEEERVVKWIIILSVIALIASLVLGCWVDDISAQTTSAQALQIGIEGQLQDLESYGFGKSTSGSQNCGKYFLYYPPPPSGDKVGLLLLVSISGEGSNRRVSVVPWGTDKFRIRVVRGLIVPTLKLLRMGGQVYPWAEISISPEDLKLAPCLSAVNR
ncbi:MAG: hypothetical protein G01um101430_176 [Parcubacteria group bacterium Gr01-1014_30]|nr:MAG: hypothetical protein G01um101430_176 [Parcubacteria group bacterium Gr01-1014_30]